MLRHSDISRSTVASLLGILLILLPRRASLKGMDDFVTARSQWTLLRRIHPLFSGRLPSTIERHNSPLEKDAVERLKNEITRLRTEIRVNILAQDQHQDDFQKLDHSLVDDFMQSAGDLLAEFESLISDEIHYEEAVE